jgi:hypothetical protein
MGRRVVTEQLQATGENAGDGYASRVVKYVPADIIAGWLALTALLSGSGRERLTLLWVLFAVLVVLTPLWMLRATRAADKPPAWTQAVVSTVAFAVWVFATGRPFADYAFYDQVYGGVALIIFTLVTGLIIPEPVDAVLTPGDPTGERA